MFFFVGHPCMLEDAGLRTQEITVVSNDFDNSTRLTIYTSRGSGHPERNSSPPVKAKRFKQDDADIMGATHFPSSTALQPPYWIEYNKWSAG